MLFCYAQQKTCLSLSVFHGTVTLSFFSKLSLRRKFKLIKVYKKSEKGREVAEIEVKREEEKKREKQRTIRVQQKSLFRSVSGHRAGRCANVTLLWLAALATHRLSPTAPADIYSFRHGDLPTLNQHVKFRPSVFPTYLLCAGMFVYFVVGMRLRHRVLSPSVRKPVMERVKRDLCLTFSASSLFYFFLCGIKAPGQQSWFTECVCVCVGLCV